MMGGYLCTRNHSNFSPVFQAAEASTAELRCTTMHKAFSRCSSKKQFRYDREAACKLQETETRSLVKKFRQQQREV